jgi:catechol 2,3-dioxygenase-like lactoylglutathione lyase family enzyme
MNSSKLRLHTVAIDCADPAAMARFYADLLGWDIVADYAEETSIKGDDFTSINFHRIEGYQPPEWPGEDRPKQFHLDIGVPASEFADAAKRAEAGGAVQAPVQPGGDKWIVFLDPAGHPFCIFREKSA